MQVTEFRNPGIPWNYPELSGIRWSWEFLGRPVYMGYMPKIGISNSNPGALFRYFSERMTEH